MKQRGGGKQLVLLYHTQQACDFAVTREVTSSLSIFTVWGKPICPWLLVLVPFHHTLSCFPSSGLPNFLCSVRTSSHHLCVWNERNPASFTFVQCHLISVHFFSVMSTNLDQASSARLGYGPHSVWYAHNIHLWGVFIDVGRCKNAADVAYLLTQMDSISLSLYKVEGKRDKSREFKLERAKHRAKKLNSSRCCDLQLSMTY
jgi:hypothetical protein